MANETGVRCPNLRQAGPQQMGESTCCTVNGLNPKTAREKGMCPMVDAVQPGTCTIINPSAIPVEQVMQWHERKARLAAQAPRLGGKN